MMIKRTILNLPGRNSMSVFKHAISVWLSRNSKIWWIALYNLWMAASFDGITKSKAIKIQFRWNNLKNVEMFYNNINIEIEFLLSIGNPYCADIMTKSSAQLSSKSRFWSLKMTNVSIIKRMWIFIKKIYMSTNHLH